MSPGPLGVIHAPTKSWSFGALELWGRRTGGSMGGKENPGGKREGEKKNSPLGIEHHLFLFKYKMSTD